MDNNPGNRITILFMVMEFAPLNTTGNFRSLKFVKYFHTFGIDPIIVTFTPESASNIWQNAKIDNDLLNDVPEGTVIYRIPAKDRQKYYKTKLRQFITIYCHIEDNIARIWRKNLNGAIEDIVQKHKPVAMLTSLPPWSAGSLAVKLSKRYGLPLVLDMRDPWSQWSHQPFGSYIHYLLTLRRERKNFEAAKAVVSVTPQLTNIFIRSHPAIPKTRFHCIPNGYDSENHIPEKISFHPSPGNKIKIGYIGSFYFNPSSYNLIHSPWWKKKRHRKLQYVPVNEDWKYRSPYFFFKILARLFELDHHLRDLIEIHFIGHIPPWLSDMAVEFGLQDHLNMYGFRPHAEALELQKGFDFLLTTSEKLIGGEHYSLPSKLFDYVKMNKPVLAFVTNGIQRDFITASGLGLIFDPDTTETSAQKLGQLFRMGAELTTNPDYIRKYDRRLLTRQMSDVIKGVIQTG